MNIAIVGLSAGGLSCLENLIKFSEGHNIIAITNEDNIYSRCLLTNLLGKEIEEKDLIISEVSKINRATVLTGKSVVKINRDKKSLLLDNGKEISYDNLVLAIGADPLRPTYCKEEKNVFTLRYLGDAKKIEKKLRESVVIVGGGYVGIKAAYGFFKRQIKTSMVITSPYPLSVTADEETGNIVGKELIKMGIDLKLRSDVVEVEKIDGKAKVNLRDGRELISDLVVVGKGVKANIGLAKEAGLICESGIIVDEYLRTSDKDIYAIGDCIEVFDIVRKDRYMNAIWPMAVEQGYFCAMNILGRDIPYPGAMPMNSLKMGDFHLITAGILKGDNVSVYSLWHKGKNQLRKIAIKEGVLVGMAFLNNPEEAGIYVNLVKRGDTKVSDPEEFLSVTPRLDSKF